MNILSYVDFEKLFHVIRNFPELNRNFVKEDITFPLSYSSRSIKCRNFTLMNYKNMWKTDAITYHNFTIDKLYFKGYLIFTRGNEMRMTCSTLFKIQYKLMKRNLFPYVRIHPTDIILIY